MSYYDRREKIIYYLTLHGTASVHRLAKELYASEATIRRDLTMLEREGKIKRSFGGAVLSDLLNREVPLSLREHENTHAKNCIAQKAIKLVKNGDTVFLDASSTVSHLVPYLSQFNDLTVITNGPKTSLALGEYKITNLCTGGKLLPDSVAYIGQDTCSYFKHFNPDIVFLSCRGVSDNGKLCDSSLEEAHVRESMLSCTGKKVFLCDTSKFGKIYRYNFSELGKIDYAFCEKQNLPFPYSSYCKM